jgi:HEPN domain-containing protein
VSKFSWPAYPTSQGELEAMMSAIDEALVSQGLHPWQRQLHVPRKLWEAFGWSGNIYPSKVLAEQPGFTGEVLIAKAHAWYEKVYGERLKTDIVYGYAPARLGNAIWKVRFGVIFGSVQLFLDRNLANRGIELGSPSATYNILCAVEDLTQGFADRLSNGALNQHFQFHIRTHQALQWRQELPCSELLDMARADYDQATSDVLSHRNGQARWAAEQAVEKTLKGLLRWAGTPFPTGGPNGHNLKHLAGLLAQHHGITISDALLELASCSPKIRYGEEPSSDEQALIANHAVIEILDQLRQSPATSTLLNKKNITE